MSKKYKKPKKMIKGYKGCEWYEGRNGVWYPKITGWRRKKIYVGLGH